MTRVLGVELVELDLALHRDVETAAETHRHRPVLLARVQTGEGEGWGECAALVGGTAVDPPLWEVRRHAVEQAVPSLLRGDEEPPAATAIGRMVGAMLEMALLDATLGHQGRSLAVHLGATVSTVPVGTMVGIPAGRDVGALLDAVARSLGVAAGGARRLRLKIAPGWDDEPVRALRRSYPDLNLQADANGSYRPTNSETDGVGALRRIDPFRLACIEQPFAPHDLEAHVRLRSTLSTPVALDESLTTVERVADALGRGALDVACLKPARLGGLAAAVDAVGRCAAAGVGAFVGGFFETGLGRCANLALAGHAGFSVAGDLSPPVDYLGVSPFGYPDVVEGMARIPAGPGIGSAPDLEIVDRLTVWRRSFGEVGT